MQDEARTIDWSGFDDTHFGISRVKAPYVAVCIAPTEEGAAVYTIRPTSYEVAMKARAQGHVVFAVPARAMGASLRQWLRAHMAPTILILADCARNGEAVLQSAELYATVIRLVELVSNAVENGVIASYWSSDSEF